MTDELGIDLYWLPLGAGGNFVRFNGRVYEAIASRVQRRPACDLYHSGLEVHAPDGRYVIEQTPAAARGDERGVVGVGPIGAPWAWRVWGRMRYELRCWKDGIIPDVDEAVESPRRLSRELADVRRVLDLPRSVPMLVGGVTSCEFTTCGTPIRKSRGCWPEPVWTWIRSNPRPAGGRRDGRLDLSRPLLDSARSLPALNSWE